MISVGACLNFFFQKNAALKIFKLFCFLLAHFNSFLINICFSSSSVNAKNNFWVVPHLLHICVIFIDRAQLHEGCGILWGESYHLKVL